MNHPNGVLFESNCPVCNHNEFLIVGYAKDYYNNFPGDFRYVKCKNCKFIYTNPRPTNNTISELYPDSAGYLTPKPTKLLSNYYKKILRVKHGYNHLSENSLIPVMLGFLAKRKIKLLSIPDYHSKGTLFDIGASYGDHIVKMQDIGWICKGIELNENSVHHAREALGLDVTNCLIENYPENEQFDVVHMGMVLEHIIYPKDILEKVKKLIKEDGTFIFSVPNINSFEAKVFGKYWYSLHLPMHLNHFDRKSVTKLLIEFGFNKIKIYHQFDPNDIIISLKYLSIEKKRYAFLYKIIKIKFIRKLIITPFLILLSLFNYTSRMTIYAKKQKP
jgi:2-polyprenyl-3-methyl-5-hydroxy-6-metoxy-1,4-benzoquinol methylase